ncbi:MAG: ATP-binding protein [Candidatus Pacearchaeota archaeon]
MHTKEELRKSIEGYSAINPKILAIASAVSELSARTRDPAKVRKIICDALEILGYTASYEQPETLHTQLQLGTHREITGKTSVGEIYLSGVLKDEELRELTTFANLAGLSLDYSERGETWRKQEETDAEIGVIVRHDLRGPAGKLEMISQLGIGILARLENEVTKESKELKQAVYDLKRWVTSMGSAGTAVADIAGLLSLSGFSYEDLRKNSEYFSPLEAMKMVVEGRTHEVVVKGKSIKIYYPKALEKLNLYTNHPAFSCVFANLLRNAIYHGAGYSPVEVIFERNKENFLLCIENQAHEILDTRMLKEIFKKGYTTKTRETPLTGNDGLGLPIIEKIVKTGYHGNIAPFSGLERCITDERKKGLERLRFSDEKEGNPSIFETLDFPWDYTRPGFYIEVQIPMESLVKPKS